jgi:hypothetical protein
VDKAGIMRLMWKPFNENAIPPKFMKPKKLPEKGKEKVNVTIFRNGWCPNFNIAYERAIRASGEFSGKINLQEFNTTNETIVEEWGISDGLFIDGKEVKTGPAPGYKKLVKKISKRVNKKK